ncbi:MAG TPA: aminodeoxychorismate synthase component I [Thermoleophilaceae bacterium]|nr:aminodeoxychorismate synthase component I [Thermoleophilaceae bacterium]
MPLPDRARLVAVALDGDVSATDGSLLVRGDGRPFALAGVWAGGGALVGSEPVAVGRPEDDPFELIERQPEVAAAGHERASGAVGGGWFGYIGYGLGRRLEAVPPPPPRPVPLPPFALAFYDHLLRLDSNGRWWFEALWSDERDAALSTRLELLRRRLATGVQRAPARLGVMTPAPPSGAGHLAAVAECRERIAAGEIFQANICLRLDGRVEGGAFDLFARAAGDLSPAYAGVVGGEWGAVCSLSPELFLRRRGRDVVTEPIKGTAPLGPGAAEVLAGSQKDRAENVMIVDLMRNDLGRVCEYGSVKVRAMHEPRRAPGVWHLVSTVAGTLRVGASDGDLLRATFPPGSVTGAPKIRAMRVIAELEATGREAYTGALGYVSPVAGLEFNVAIRTLEMRGECAWLGAGGGIVADSDPARELEECLVKARPVVAAAGGHIAEPRLPHALPPPALLGGATRPDPELGVFSTMLVSAGEPVDLRAHLERLAESAAAVYGARLPHDVEERVRAAAASHAHARLRLLLEPSGAPRIEVTPLRAGCRRPPATLAPVLLPGGLGAHKWRDRRLLRELERRLGAMPLIVDQDGDVLEAATANVWIVEGDALVTPPLDGRLLPGTVRARLLALAAAREEHLELGRLAGADEIFLTSAISGMTPARLDGGPPARSATIEHLALDPAELRP